MGIILTKEQQKKLREQELQVQKYHIEQLFNFINRFQTIEVIHHMITWKLERFNHFDKPDMIITILGSGVYIFFQDRKIQYIGSSKKMRNRIRKHAMMQDRKRYYPDDRIITIGTITWENAKEIEDRLVILIKPPRNKKKTLQGKGRY